ncbi:MAG: hypothetical protein KGN02_03305, partial [bacterium]|nr:hypothetical protein [bacterium]
MKSTLLSALCAAVASCSLALPAVASGTAPSATTYYEEAVAHMKALPQPAFVAYSARLHSYGAHIEASRVPKTGRLAIALFIGSSRQNDQAYPGMERASDDLISLLMPDGTHAVSHFAFVNPTWGGAYDTMRYGWEGRPDTPSPADAKGARPAPSPSAIPVIAIEQAIGSGFYRVYDEGPATCESGAQGHRVHLVARSNPSDHPL